MLSVELFRKIKEAAKKGYNWKKGNRWVVKSRSSCDVCKEKCITTGIINSPYFVCGHCMIKFKMGELQKIEEKEAELQKTCVTMRTSELETQCILIRKDKERAKQVLMETHNMIFERKAEMEKCVAHQKAEAAARKNGVSVKTEEQDVAQALMQLSRGGRA